MSAGKLECAMIGCTNNSTEGMFGLLSVRGRALLICVPCEQYLREYFVTGRSL